MKQLTKEQIKKLPKLFDAAKKDNADQEVNYIRENREEAEDFVVDYLKSQGIKRPIVRECGVFEFGSVGMHTDYGIEDKFSMVVMLRGKGCINFLENRKLKGRELEKHSIVVFQHSKPHSFINKSGKKCAAIIANLSTKQAKKLLTQTKS